MAIDRMKKINEQIGHELSFIVLELFPGFSVSITKVETSRDLSHSKVWIEAREDKKEIVSELQKESKEIKKQLSKKVAYRKVPDLHFVFDDTGKSAAKIDKLIEKIKREEEDA